MWFDNDLSMIYKNKLDDAKSISRIIFWFSNDQEKNEADLNFQPFNKAFFNISRLEIIDIGDIYFDINHTTQTKHRHLPSAVFSLHPIRFCSACPRAKILSASSSREVFEQEPSSS
ncbi:hypothetical protein CDAR_97491 [Caerostris darwini]|uniref:Uncharacterized protein n=1 Tax=Caerostris darwini TaxID=1538125 RepID=A0AAV4PSG5_9ARAC|nr:hypothetical protein CDAR_97491 [Caerostris darwini]